MNKMEKYRYHIIRTIVLAVTVIMLFCCINTQNVRAAGTSTKSKAVYTVKKCNDTYKKPNGKAGAKYSYDLVQLKGNSDAVKKINASLKKDYKRTLIDGRDFIYRYAKDHVKAYTPNITPQTYFYKNKCKIMYNRGGYISIIHRIDMCANSDVDISRYTQTFSLKTGKKLNISDVVSGSEHTVKNKITQKCIHKLEDIYQDDADFAVSATDISEFNFYLKNGKVIVYFNPFDLGYFEGVLKISLKGNY